MSQGLRAEAPIVCEIRDRICHIILNNPPYNMMDKRWSECFSGMISGIAPSQIDGIVIYGAGRHFSAGAVLDNIQQTAMNSYRVSHRENSFPMSQDSESFQKLSEFPRPVVAAMRGVCIGSGFELALACHYRICDEHATMGLVESTFGLMPGCGGTLRLPALVGTARGLKLILTGERVGSDAALSLRIVSTVVHHSELLPKAVDYIRKAAPLYRARHEARLARAEASPFVTKRMDMSASDPCSAGPAISLRPKL